MSQNDVFLERFAASLSEAIGDIRPEDFRQLHYVGFHVRVGLTTFDTSGAAAKELRERNVNFQDTAQIEAYLDILLTETMTADPWSTRRLAELYELQGDTTGALQWWQRAASLGEPHAIQYVEVLREHNWL